MCTSTGVAVCNLHQARHSVFPVRRAAAAYPHPKFLPGVSRVLYTRNFKLLAFAIVSLALVLGVAISQLFETRHFIQELSDSYTRTLAFRKTRNWLLDAEAGQRGYLITGDRSYLANYDEAVERLPEQIRNLLALCEGDSQQTRRARRLLQVAESKLEEMRQSIEVRERDGFPAARALTLSDIGKSTMNEARQIVEDALRGEDVVQASMKRHQLRGVYVTTTLIVVSGLLCLAAGVNVFLLFQKAIRASLMQRRLLIQRRRAITADREKSRFMANMSHEIRTPMNAILGFTQLLEDEVGSERARHYVRAIGTAGESLMNLINDVLDLSKIDAGRVELRLEVIDLREVVTNLRMLLSQRAAEKGLTLRAEVAEDCPAWLRLDALRFRQMLLNLLSNAVKFTTQGSVNLRVSCETASGAESLTLIGTVSDTGKGIAPGEIEAIFKPFRQGSRHDGNAEQGTGLGLSITRRLAHLMGGTVRATSTLGKGSTFTLRLPDVEIPAALPSTDADTEDVADLNGVPAMKVLIVDDNAFNREIMGGFFQKTHHTVNFATDGLEAVEQAVRERPDLILMDIRMPRLDGREATAAIRRNQDGELARTPVIAVTASSLSESPSEVRKSFDGYLRKPFLRHQLVEVIREVVASVPSLMEPDHGEPDASGNAGPQMLTGPAAVTLRGLLRDRWPVITRTMGVRAIGQFASELKDLAASANCASLREFAASLQSAASACQISGMERALARFPALVDALAPDPPSTP